MKYSHHQTKYTGKQVGLRTYQHPCQYKGVDKPDQEGNKLQQQKILILIYPIYNHNWRNISTIYIYNKTSIKRNILTIKQIYREVGRAKDLSAPPINVSSITISALCIIVWRRIGISRRECLANTQNLTATLAHKQGRLFTPSSRGTNFSAGTILFFIFDK